MRFGRFQLDEQSRSLRLDGQAQPLQPLVFDLLVYLVRNKERVVPKDELLARLWADTIVTDGSLQRAVSLLRQTLREGGMPDAIETFARRGYRFNTDEWTASLKAARPREAAPSLERTVAACEDAKDFVGAARAALVLTNVKLELRELAVARGWLERAKRLLADEPLCKQHGLAEWLSSRVALFESRLDDCRAHAAKAKAIGTQLKDQDVAALGLVYEGHILIATGQVRLGLAMHDEAGAHALSERVDPFIGGIVFCSIVWAYLHLGDHHRAGQWTDEFTRWCEHHTDYAYPALCRLHRGEVLAARGELQSAEVEVRSAQRALVAAGPYCEGDAHRVLGEIRFALGDFKEAEQAFQQAHQLGWSPEPGMSLLLAAQGNGSDALRQLRRALDTPSWTHGQRRGILLAVLARIAAQVGELDEARAALAELDTLPQQNDTQACAAERSRALAEVAHAEGKPAEPQLRQTIALWLSCGARLQAADTRVRLAQLLLAQNELGAAALELTSAEAVYREVGATSRLHTCEALRQTTRSGTP